MKASITFETITEASASDGDCHDHGWIQPGTERRRSLRLGGSRMYDRNLRMARAGRFDWTLREAIAFLSGNAEGPCERPEVGDTRVETEGRVRLVSSVSIRCQADGYEIVMGRNGYEYGGATSYTLHVHDVTEGTARRLAQLYS